MKRKMSKEERKVWRGLIVKVINFVRSLDPDEVMLLGRYITSLMSPKIELDDDD